MIKRIFDVLMALLGITILAIPILVIAVLVRITSPGPVLFWSARVGQYNRLFQMPKFRSMRVGTPAVATHLLKDPQSFLTPIGSFLRRTSLDEIPQLWCILIGHMSLVGPRPALFNQDDLILLRTEKGIDCLRPGLTGWAQINGRDDLAVPEKVHFDEEYLMNQSFAFDLRILVRTALGVLARRNVAH
ncbi:sugar transferase [Pseudorhizobium flavum]|uniref:sugar transferase n=1 Tax=Pseudorhizobium flavum TaxID=1335061 RepID=UPI002492AE7C|nr:sugar transferase [Pseudorhizobium flavum]